MPELNEIEVNTIDPQSVDNGLQTAIDRIVASYKAKFEEIGQKTREDIERDPPPDHENWEQVIGLHFEVTMKRRSWKLHIPEFYSERHDISFDLPEVRMERDHIVFHVPAVRMVRKHLFNKPVFRHWKWYNEPVYGNFPEPYMKKVEIKLDMPKITMKRQRVKFDLPTIRMKLRELKFDVPEFKLVDPDEDMRNYEDHVNSKANASREVIAAETERMKAEIRAVAEQKISETFDAARQRMTEERERAEQTFSSAVAEMKTAIKTLKAQGANDQVRAMEIELSDLISQMSATLNSFDQSMVAMNAQEQQAIQTLLESLDSE